MTYSKVRINGEIYSVGDDVHICDNGNDYLIAKIIKIKPTKGISKYPYWPTVLVQWYYRKSDIETVAGDIPGLKINCISDYELFSSNHKDYIFIETIVSKILVLKFNQYEKLNDINGNVYFTRAFYDPVKVRVLLFYLFICLFVMIMNVTVISFYYIMIFTNICGYLMFIYCYLFLNNLRNN